MRLMALTMSGTGDLSGTPESLGSPFSPFLPVDGPPFRMATATFPCGFSLDYVKAA